MSMTVFAPGAVVANRNRLWRVDAQEAYVPLATAVEGGEAQEARLYLPLETVQSGRLEPTSAHLVGHPAAQGFLLRAYRLSLLLRTFATGSASFISAPVRLWRFCDAA